jgi:hypothetical protein
MMSTSGQVNRNQAIGLAEICNRRMLKGIIDSFQEREVGAVPDDEKRNSK